ncbi:uncharacterized protein CDV56_103364 [Aspergillus thermomutatus]|uniref:Uncharacterized protein n=1 Tax=Aspergillus thermomutatus TaxID=41047 RepID=A0A397HE61_ASPTH|nr:uncharacterized protein CDV56_103364 [Aspergillus thermomutatus]RHZ61431.1 hypothetical protein CDV56_103364 [Aspergillus thermomutatus]
MQGPRQALWKISIVHHDSSLPVEEQAFHHALGLSIVLVVAFLAEGLPKEILRADLVRNFYMYLFGGYVLLAGVFFQYYGHRRPWNFAGLASQDSILVQRAFMGRMAHSDDLMASAAVPNGWMASPPGHPFWLMNIIVLMEHPEGTGDGTVEGLTGPGMLSLMIKYYTENFKMNR